MKKQTMLSSIFLSIYLSIYLLSVYLSIYLFLCFVHQTATYISNIQCAHSMFCNAEERKTLALKTFSNSVFRCITQWLIKVSCCRQLLLQAEASNHSGKTRHMCEKKRIAGPKSTMLPDKVNNQVWWFLKDIDIELVMCSRMQF